MYFILGRIRFRLKFQVQVYKLDKENAVILITLLKAYLNKYVSPNLLSTNDFAFVIYKQKLKEPEAGNGRQLIGNEPYMLTHVLS